jgi:hypothetical protein
LEGRIEGIVTAAVKRKLGAVELGTRLGGDINDSSGAVPKLGGHGSRNQSDRLDQVGIDFLPKTIEALRQQNAIDAILHVAVIAAHMYLPEFLLHNPRRLQKHLLKRRAFALAHCLNLVGPIV